MKWIVKLILNSLALIIADALVPGFAIRGFFSAITFFTLGLFIFIINGLAFWIASWLVSGFTVYGFWGAFWGAIITSIVSWVLNGIFRAEK
jgi:putative membrane protein